MANVNRYVNGEKRTLLINVASGITVELGDLMFIDDADNLRFNGSSTGDNYGYPIENLRISGSSLELNRAELKNHFLGVALDDKDGISGGFDRKLTIATSGQFNFDLKPAKTIRVGQMFGSSGTSTASNLLNQKIAQTTDSNIALGYFTESKVHAKTADVIIRTIFGSGLI